MTFFIRISLLLNMTFADCETIPTFSKNGEIFTKLVSDTKKVFQNYNATQTLLILKNQLELVANYKIVFQLKNDNGDNKYLGILY